jgi:hypothetical protein
LEAKNPKTIQNSIHFPIPKFKKLGNSNPNKGLLGNNGTFKKIEQFNTN